MQKYPRGLTIENSYRAMSNVSLVTATTRSSSLMWKDPKLWDFVSGRGGREERGETLSEKCLWREIKIKTGARVRAGACRGGWRHVGMMKWEECCDTRYIIHQLSHLPPARPAQPAGHHNWVRTPGDMTGWLEQEQVQVLIKQRYSCTRNTNGQLWSSTDRDRVTGNNRAVLDGFY